MSEMSVLGGAGLEVVPNIVQVRQKGCRGESDRRDEGRRCQPREEGYSCQDKCQREALYPRLDLAVLVRARLDSEMILHRSQQEKNDLDRRNHPRKERIYPAGAGEPQRAQDEDLVGERIQNGAPARSLITGACETSVEEVAGRGQAEKNHGRPRPFRCHENDGDDEQGSCHRKLVRGNPLRDPPQRRPRRDLFFLKGHVLSPLSSRMHPIISRHTLQESDGGDHPSKKGMQCKYSLTHAKILSRIVRYLTIFPFLI